MYLIICKIHTVYIQDICILYLHVHISYIYVYIDRYSYTIVVYVLYRWINILIWIRILFIYVVVWNNFGVVYIVICDIHICTLAWACVMPVHLQVKAIACARTHLSSKLGSMAQHIQGRGVRRVAPLRYCLWILGFDQPLTVARRCSRSGTWIFLKNFHAWRPGRCHQPCFWPSLEYGEGILGMLRYTSAHLVYRSAQIWEVLALPLNFLDNFFALLL